LLRLALLSGTALPRGRDFAGRGCSGAEVRGPCASLSPFRAKWVVAVSGSRDLPEPPVIVGCFDKLEEASGGALKMFLGRSGLLRTGMTELEVGFEKICDFVVLAPADDPWDLVGELLLGAEGFLRSWLVVLLLKGVLAVEALGEGWPLYGENRERRFFRRYSRGKLM